MGTDFNMGPPPYPLEWILRDATAPDGAYHGNYGHETSVIVDYPFVTGRSTPDSYLTGQKMVEVLEQGLRSGASIAPPRARAASESRVPAPQTGRFAIVEQLLADGIDYMFGNPGTVEQGLPRRARPATRSCATSRPCRRRSRSASPTATRGRRGGRPSSSCTAASASATGSA